MCQSSPQAYPVRCPTCQQSAGCPAMELVDGVRVFCADPFHGDLSACEDYLIPDFEALQKVRGL